MARCVCLTVVVLTIVALGGVAAQEPLTLERAAEASLAHNASLRAGRAGANEATAHRTEARSGFFPRLSVTESWQRGDQPVFVFSSLLSAQRFAATNVALDALNHPEPIAFFHTSVGAARLGVRDNRVVFDEPARDFHR